MRVMAPVPKSNPVAHTMTSSSRIAVGRLDAGLGDPHHRGVAQVDERHVRPVERLEVAGDVGRALLAVAVVLRDQPLGGVGVVDELADLAGDELAPLGVGVGVHQDVDVVAGELHEPGAGPHLARRTPAAPRACRRTPTAGSSGGGTRGSTCSAPRGAARSRPAARACSSAVIGRLLSGVHQLAVRWYTVSDSTSSTIAGTTCTPLDEVPTTATRLPREVDRLGRPPAGVVLHAAEVVAAGDVGQVRHRQHAGGGDEEAGPSRRAVVGGDGPGAGGSSQTAAVTGGAEADVAPEVEPVDHVVEVALGLGLAGEVLLPLPLVEELLREEVAVGVALGVEPGAGVAVPEPGAADAAAGLDAAARRTRPRRARCSW